LLRCAPPGRRRVAGLGIFSVAFQVCGGLRRSASSIVIRAMWSSRSLLPRTAFAIALVALPLSACTTTKATGDSRSGDLAKIREVMAAIDARYVKDVPDDALVKDALKGMVGGLDPHSSYLDAKEYAEFQATTRGEFAGIGAELARDGARVRIITPIDDTPAARGGVRPGDIIERVNGEAIDGLDLGQVVERIRGTPGTTVALTLSRGTEPSFDVTLTRAIIPIQPVKAQLLSGGIGYLRLTAFNEHTEDRLREELRRLERDAGGQLAGLVLDLRNNPGGLLNQSVSVTGEFIGAGLVVSTRGRDGRAGRSYEAATLRPRAPEVPMVALINGATASAAEIVAAALQDHGRATIVGTRSFGKGSIQQVVPLSGGTAIRITTGLYYSPKGRAIQAEGVSPDIVATAPEDQQVRGARIRREADLRNAIKPRNGASRPAVGEEAASGTVDPFVLGTERDAQLTRALEVLRTRTARSRG
jgi:carboxyl-terminal processing protease